MGLLEDAIKEHLELKKAHGADEQAEVPEPAEPPPPPAPMPEPVAEAPEPTEPPTPPTPDPEPVAEVAEVPEPAEPPPPPQPAPEPVAQAAVEPDVPTHENLFGEQATLPPTSEEAGDLLEATPEFFQETPEYDRLWFEEKAPKDFNFDS